MLSNISKNWIVLQMKTTKFEMLTHQHGMSGALYFDDVSELIIRLFYAMSNDTKTSKYISHVYCFQLKLNKFSNIHKNMFSFFFQS